MKQKNQKITIAQLRNMIKSVTGGEREARGRGVVNPPLDTCLRRAMIYSLSNKTGAGQWVLSLWVEFMLDFSKIV